MYDGEIGHDDGDECLATCPLTSCDGAVGAGLRLLAIFSMGNGDTSGRWKSYRENSHGADNARHNDKGRAAEQCHECELLTDADFDSPEERKWDGHEVEIGYDVRNDDDEDA